MAVSDFAGGSLSKTATIPNYIDYVVASLNEYFEANGMDQFPTSDFENLSLFDDSEGHPAFLYVDFDGSDGYLVLDNQGNPYCFDTAGDHPEFLENDSPYCDDLAIFCDHKIVASKQFLPSQDRNGSYVESVYQGDYTEISYQLVDSFVAGKYAPFSPYVISSDTLDGLSTVSANIGYGGFDDTVYQTDSNCGILALANGLAYYSHYGDLDELPAYNATTIIHPYVDEPYASVALINDPILAEKTLHTLYADCLNYAIIADYDGYSGMSYWMEEYVWWKVALQYGYSDTFNQLSSYSLSTIQTYIADNVPIMLSVEGDSCYDDHDMMITGYRQYWDVMEIATFTVPIQVVMVSVFPGTGIYECWYDLTYLGNFGSYYTRAYSQKITPMILEESI